MEGPVRSTSRMPTDLLARERERASWVVIEDLPTPPLPDSTCHLQVSEGSVAEEIRRVERICTKTMCLTLSKDITFDLGDACV